MEPVVGKGTKRKAVASLEPTMLPDLGAVLAKPSPVASPAALGAPAAILGSETGGVVSAKSGGKYPALSTILMCGEATETVMSKIVNKTFASTKWRPPECDVVDAKGVMLFPAAAGFELYPAAMNVLTIRELRERLGHFGFTTATVDALPRPAAKQLLMWKYTEAAFVAHQIASPAPAEYARAVMISAPWTREPAVPQHAQGAAGLANARSRRGGAGDQTPPRARVSIAEPRVFTPGLRAALLVAHVSVDDVSPSAPIGLALKHLQQARRRMGRLRRLCCGLRRHR